MWPFVLLPGIVLTVICMGGVLVWTRKRKLSSSQLRAVDRMWGLLDVVRDPGRKVLEATKILSWALSSLGYEGSLGEQVKAASIRKPLLKQTWNVIKLRNRIAHEPGCSVSEEEAHTSLRTIRRALDVLS
jgi:hypothetical protein